MIRRLRPSRRFAVVALLITVLLVTAGVWWFTTGPDGFRGPQCGQVLGSGCREISGRVLYVEEQDPDGDGTSISSSLAGTRSPAATSPSSS